MAGVILLSASQMRAVEQAAMDKGISGAFLMEEAGKKAAAIAMRGWSKRPTVVLCGPGNNGGDGFVVARILQTAGWPVKVAFEGSREALKGDAKLMAGLYAGDIVKLKPESLAGAELIIDALFGTGLTRPIDGDLKAVIDAANQAPAPVLAVDVPSGIHTDTGAAIGAAIQAARTVTFFQKKPGHVLYPGRAFCGVVDVVDIGITPEHGAAITPDTYENQPPLWGRNFPRPSPMMHKYHRGSVMTVSGGPENTGAARLAAHAALRIGAGLVTVLSPSAALAANAAHLTAVMLKPADTGADIKNHLINADKYPYVAIIGPASGIGGVTREKTLSILQSRAAAVIDADAITSFADDRDQLIKALRPNDILTPHGGEFMRLFPKVDPAAGKLAAARTASKESGAVIVLKGPDTVIAAPDGRAAVNVNAPPDLATAGAGDVLAGFIAGLRAQGMPGFEAACVGVWFHGACGSAIGPGLVAEDLQAAVPSVLRALLSPPAAPANETANPEGPGQ